MTGKPETNDKSAPAEVSDADVLQDAFEHPHRVSDDGEPKPSGDNPPDSGKEPEAKKKDDKPPVPPKKERQYKTYGEALAGVLHWEAAAGKTADKLKEKDRAITALETRLAELEQRLTAQPSSEPKEDRTADEDDDNPLFQEIERRVERKIEAKLKPLQDTRARDEAKEYNRKMKDLYGEAWDGLKGHRDSLVVKWKSGNMQEPELWQLASIGKLFLDQSIKADDIETDDSPSGVTDRRGAAKTPASIDKPGEETDEDVITKSLNGLRRRPMGTAPIH